MLIKKKEKTIEFDRKKKIHTIENKLVVSSGKREAGGSI